MTTVAVMTPVMDITAVPEVHKDSTIPCRCIFLAREDPTIVSLSEMVPMTRITTRAHGIIFATTLLLSSGAVVGQPANMGSDTPSPAAAPSPLLPAPSASGDDADSGATVRGNSCNSGHCSCRQGRCSCRPRRCSCRPGRCSCRPRRCRLIGCRQCRRFRIVGYGGVLRGCMSRIRHGGSLFSPPPGDMVLHHPYETWRAYYYYRPYQMLHVEELMSGAVADHSLSALSQDVFCQIHNEHANRLVSAETSGRDRLEFTGCDEPVFTNRPIQDDPFGNDRLLGSNPGSLQHLPDQHGHLKIQAPTGSAPSPKLQLQPHPRLNSLPGTESVPPTAPVPSQSGLLLDELQPQGRVLPAEESFYSSILQKPARGKQESPSTTIFSLDSKRN